MKRKGGSEKNWLGEGNQMELSQICSWRNWLSDWSSLLPLIHSLSCGWNGEKLPAFKPSRDPLRVTSLPVSFCSTRNSLIWVMMLYAVVNGFTRQGPHLSHVCFADDIVLFGEASTNQLSVMMSILDLFCEASGERISLAKSKLLVSKNINHNQAVAQRSHCGIPLTDDLGKYLGTPMKHGRVTKLTTSSLLSNTQARLNTWAKKFFRQSHFDSLCGYQATSCKPPCFLFMLPITNLKSSWEVSYGETLPTKDWDKLCLPKDHGGLNIRDVKKPAVQSCTFFPEVNSRKSCLPSCFGRSSVQYCSMGRGNRSTCFLKLLKGS